MIVEKFTSLTYTEIIGHPNYLQLKDFIAQKFGYSIEIFPCMTFFENPFCDYRSEEDQLKNHFNNVGFMCMNIFSQAINDALSNLKKNHWVCLRQKISVKEEKIVDCFMVNQKENIENWIDFQKIIRDNAKDQTGTYLDKKYKEITGKPETSDVTENEDGFIYVNWTNKSIDKSNELGEVILCFSSPTFDDILQDYSEVKLNMTLHEFRAGIIDNPEKNSNTPKSYRFCKLKQEKMINPTSYKDFKTLSLQDEKTVKIKEIQFQPDFYDKKSAVLIVPHDVTVNLLIIFIFSWKLLIESWMENLRE